MKIENCLGFLLIGFLIGLTVSLVIHEKQDCGRGYVGEEYEAKIEPLR